MVWTTKNIKIKQKIDDEILHENSLRIGENKRLLRISVISNVRVHVHVNVYIHVRVHIQIH